MKDNRPRVFVSSTIFDFKDLRSAIRFWLEENGYQVLFSEFNDFPQTPDKNSYDSCLRAIDSSDYFTLLVGSRVGGTYGSDGVSITRMEYQYAYERLKKGLIKIIPFVRKEIWDIREDRKALHDLLQKELKLDPEAATKLAHHSSKLIDDARHIFDFLSEITRNQEMKQAVKGQAALPVGNWIYQFSSFRDIVDALRVVMRVSGHLRKAALAANLKLEIARNMRQLYERREKGYSPMTELSMPARACLKGNYSDSSKYKGKYLCWLGMFMIGAPVLNRLEEFALREAVTSGEFLEFDIQSNQFRPGKLQSALLDIIERIKHLKGTIGSKHWLHIQENVVLPYKRAGEESHTLPNGDLVSVFAMHDRLLDLHDLFCAVYKTLDGDSSLLDSLRIRPTTPLADEAQKLTSEQPSLSEMIHFLEALSTPSQHSA